MMKTGIRKLIIAAVATVTVFAACTLTTGAATLKNITNVYITKSGNTYHVNYDCSSIDSKRIYAKTLYNILKDGNYKMCKTCAKEIGMNIDDSQKLTLDMLPYETTGEIHMKESSESSGGGSSDESLNSSDSNSSGNSSSGNSSDESLNSSSDDKSKNNETSSDGSNSTTGSDQTKGSEDTSKKTTTKNSSNSNSNSNSKTALNSNNNSKKTTSKNSSGSGSKNSSGVTELMTQKQRRNKFLSKSNPARGKKPKTEERPDNDGYAYADFARFNSYNSDNGLGGTPIYLFGTIKDVQAVKQNGSVYGVAVMVDDSDGYQWYMRCNCNKANFDALKADLKGKKANIFGTYAGYSGVTNRPMMDMARLVDADGNDTDLSLYK